MIVVTKTKGGNPGKKGSKAAGENKVKSISTENGNAGKKDNKAEGENKISFFISRKNFPLFLFRISSLFFRRCDEFSLPNLAVNRDEKDKIVPQLL